MAENILITGGTGLVGKKLSKLLINKGYTVSFLSRTAGEIQGITKFAWDLNKAWIDPRAFENIDHVIHLAGAGIADKRWTAQYKKEIYDSRILSTRLLTNEILKHKPSLKSFVSTSAIGIYGNNTDDQVGETANYATNFLAKVCADWEQETVRIQELGIRTTIFRIGVVLAKESGFVPQVAKPIRYGVGAALGNGNQKISWVHIDDLCAMFLRAIQQTNMHGVYNAVAPEETDNKSITYLMAKLLHRPILFPPIPTFLLKIVFGEMATLLVASQSVSSAKLSENGFQFQCPELEKALRSLI